MVGQKENEISLCLVTEIELVICALCESNFLHWSSHLSVSALFKNNYV